ncbi:hypothetical protein [Gimesia maris]|uniref:hypothetical protein n=1 Tax=Gimesia maris TaxID=122 RepID=UPI0032ECF730|tara:strand:- start:122 stop:583 length:462 start_codon:yes stop_codon:yes gene_type:complete
MEPAFQSESWEQTGPSYIQSYIVSAFLLVGILSIASARVPLTPMSFIFMSLWFGCFLYWLVQNRHAERTFASDRITVADGHVSHTFRYTITEAEHTDMAVTDIKKIKIHSGTPIAVELIGEHGGDFFLLPNMQAVTRLEEVLLKHNSNIEIVK